jgi:hypothetical protein
VHVCNDCPPRKTAPIRGSGATGPAVTVAVAVALAAAFTDEDEDDDGATEFCFDAVGPVHDGATAAQATSRRYPARRMSTDLARRIWVRQRAAECTGGGWVFQRCVGPCWQEPRSAGH